MEEADQQVLVHAQRKGWPTQASTAAMVVLYQFGIELARLTKSSRSAEVVGLEDDLTKVPTLLAQTLEKHNEPLKTLAQEEADHPLYLYTAGGPCFASAFIGAAKVKELSPDHAIAIPLEEYHHYNSQKVDEPLFLIAPDGPSLSRALDTAREGKRFGGKVYSIISEGNEMLKENSDLSFLLPKMDERLTPLVYTIPVQLFAFHVAMAKFKIAEGENE